MNKSKMQACLLFPNTKAKTERKRKKVLAMEQIIKTIKNGQLANGFNQEKMYLNKLLELATLLPASLTAKFLLKMKL